MDARFAVLVGLSGCATLGGYQSARPLAPGKWEVGGELTGTLTKSRDEQEFHAAPALAVRTGVADGVDLGIRLGAVLPELYATIALDRDGVAWALAPALGATYSRTAYDTWLVAGRCRLLMGIPVGDHELVLGAGPVVAWGHAARGREWGSTLAPSASATLLLAAGPVRVVPEIALAWPSVAVSGAGVRGSGAVAVETGLAVQVRP